MTETAKREPGFPRRTLLGRALASLGALMLGGRRTDAATDTYTSGNISMAFDRVTTGEAIRDVLRKTGVAFGDGLAADLDTLRIVPPGRFVIVICGGDIRSAIDDLLVLYHPSHAMNWRLGRVMRFIEGMPRYSASPSITPASGGGCGATATAVVSHGRVVAVLITDSGSGYERAPAVRFE